MTSSYPSANQLRRMKVADLRALCNEKAASTEGTKAILVERLLGIFSEEEYLISRVPEDDAETSHLLEETDPEYVPTFEEADEMRADDDEWEEAQILEFADDEPDALCTCNPSKAVLSTFVLSVLAAAGHFQCQTEECKSPSSLDSVDWINYRVKNSHSSFKGHEDMGFGDWKQMLVLKDVVVILGGMILLVSLVRSFLVHFIASTANERRIARSWSVMWLVVSGMIHLWMEGSFVFFRHHEYLKMDIYMVADWRYGNPMEPGTRAMEAITVLLDGPLCLLAAYAAVKDLPWRHPCQFLVCTMQIYGLIWFSLHPIFDRSIQHLSTSPFLFLGVAFGLNGPWAIFPPMLWVQSWNEMTSKFRNAIHLKEE